MQRQELLADKNIDMRPVRVRTGRMFLDGFAAIRAQEAELDLPIFAAMSPTDQVRQPLPCLPSSAGIEGSGALSVLWRLFCQLISKGPYLLHEPDRLGVQPLQSLLEYVDTPLKRLTVCWASNLDKWFHSAQQRASATRSSA